MPFFRWRGFVPKFLTRSIALALIPFLISGSVFAGSFPMQPRLLTNQKNYFPEAQSPFLSEAMMTRLTWLPELWRSFPGGPRLRALLLTPLILAIHQSGDYPPSPRAQEVLSP